MAIPMPDERRRPDTLPVEPLTVIEFGNGGQVEVVTSYPSWHGLQLHSLADVIGYVCTACEEYSESAMAATHEIPTNALVCPACYAWLTVRE